MRFEVATAGTFDAITLADARLHLKEQSNVTVEDDLIKAYVKAATKLLESKTNRVVASSTLALHLDYCDLWPDNYTVQINKFPVTAITSVQYYDTSNVLQTYNSSNYITSIGNVTRIFFENQPDCYDRPDTLKINFTAGYSAVSAVDERIKQWVRMILTDYKQVRTDSVTGTIVSPLPRNAEFILSTLRNYAV